MINSSKIFTFNGIRSDDASFPKIQNVTLNNDFYQVQLLGARTIVEDKIQEEIIHIFMMWILLHCNFL